MHEGQKDLPDIFGFRQKVRISCIEVSRHNILAIGAINITWLQIWLSLWVTRMPFAPAVTTTGRKLLDIFAAVISIRPAINSAAPYDNP